MLLVLDTAPSGKLYKPLRHDPMKTFLVDSSGSQFDLPRRRTFPGHTSRTDVVPFWLDLSAVRNIILSSCTFRQGSLENLDDEYCPVSHASHVPCEFQAHSCTLLLGIFLARMLGMKSDLCLVDFFQQHTVCMNLRRNLEDFPSGHATHVPFDECESSPQNILYPRRSQCI